MHSAMKRISVLLLVGMMAMSLLLGSCGSQKKAQLAQGASKSPFGETYDTPCTMGMVDSDTDIYAVGTAYGPRTNPGSLQQLALTNAQDLLRQKLAHKFEGAIDTYLNHISADNAAQTDAKTEGAQTQLMKGVLNLSKTYCPVRFSEADGNGRVTCFIGITVSVKEVQNYIDEQVSKAKEESVRRNESSFRERHGLNSKPAENE